MSETLSNTVPKMVEQPLVEHLIELRKRLVRSVIVVALFFSVLFFYANDLYEYIATPLLNTLPAGNTMIATEVASPFLTPFKLALLASVFLAVPYILFQVWNFVLPALYKQERKLVTPLLSSSIALFYAGIAFSYYVVFPLVFSFFTSHGPESVAIMTDISAYLDFVIKMFFAFGLAFELPIVIIIIVTSGLTTVESLKAKRPYIVVGCFVAGMLFTPPDVISQTLLAIPLWILFELGLQLANLAAKSR